MTGQSYGSPKLACAILLTLSMLLAVVSRASGQTVTLSSTSHNFGQVGVGGTSNTFNVTLRNTSTTTALSVTSIVASTPFAETNTCGTSVAASGSCRISITFKPTALGAATGSVVVTDNASPATQTVTLSGTGIGVITDSTSSVNFPSTAVGSTSTTTRRITLTNNLAAAVPLTIASSSAEFPQSNTCGTSLAASATCAITVSFAPTATGPQSGTITVTYTGAGSPLTVALTGTGVAPVTLTPASHNFANTGIGQTSATFSFTVHNNTTAAQTLTSSATAPFAVTSTGTCGTSVAASSTCTIGVTFSPTATGAATGTLTVAYGGTSPATSTLTGNGTNPIRVGPNPVSFSTTLSVGTPSQPHTVNITNNSSTAVSLDSIVASPAAFAITGNTCGTSVAANSACTLTIVFTPAVVGTTTGTLTVTYGATNVPITVAMTGGATVNRLVSLVITGNANLAAGASEQLTATGTFANGSTGNVTTAAAWSSSNTAVATVGSATGLVTGVAAGTVTITAAVAGTNNGTVQNTASLTVTGTAATLTTITLTGTQGSKTPLAPPTLAAGTTDQVYATGTYSNGSTQDITTTATWASSSANATVAKGLITAVTAGTATISASLSGISSNSVTATITAATLQSISITPGTATVAAGNSQQFTATGTYSNNTTQNITSQVAWTSSNTGVTINAAGLATTTDAAINQTANISASMSGVTAATPAVLTVGPAALVSLAVTPANPSIADGTTETFTATGTYSDTTTQNLTSTVTWSATTASGGGAATFTANVAKATAAGTVTITATSGTIKGSTTLTVTAPVLTSIMVTDVAPANPPVAGTPATVTIYQGQTEQFYALGTYSDSSIQNLTSQVAWSAGTGNVATVSTSGATAGLATAVGAGEVQVSASLTGITSTATGGGGNLTVIGLNSVTVTPSDPTATPDPSGANNTLQFTATANFADNTTRNVTASSTWTSGTTTVATIGGTTGLATMVAAGTSTITAKYAGVSGSTTLTVSPATVVSVAVCVGAYPSTNCSTSTTPVGVTLGLNGMQQFSAVANYSDGTALNVTNSATWSSGNALVSVSATGLATVVNESSSGVPVAITASYGGFAPNQNIDTAFVSTLALASACSSPTIDMKLLVINNAAAGYVDFPAIQQILNYVGTPYDVVDVSAAAPTLSDGACHAFYQGVIFANSADYNNISWRAALISFEQTFGIRQLNWYTTPGPDFGLSLTSQIPSSENYTVNFVTPGAAPIFFYANLATQVTITNAAIDLASAAPASGGVLTPLMTDASGNIVSAIYTFNGQQFLSQTFDSNPFLTHDLVVAYGLLNWVTQGVFLGDYHVYATQQVDDNFINDAEWIPSTPCLATPGVATDRTAPDASNLPVFRANSNDMAQLVAWQTAKQADPLLSPGVTNETSANSGKFELTLAMNGVGTTGNGDWTGLVAPIVSDSAAAGVVTFTANDFSGQVGDTVTIANTRNGGGTLNGGPFTITKVTLSAAAVPGTNTFTVMNANAPNFTTTSENPVGVDGDSTTPTVSETDSLVANLQNYQQNFHWISHTYDHPSTLNGLCQNVPSPPGCNPNPNSTDTGDDIDLEILTNLYVASASGGVNQDTTNNPCIGGGSVGYCDTVAQLKFTDFNPANIVTPGVTGLNDPNVPGFLANDGIRFAVSDTSVATTTNPPNNNGPNPSPNVGIVNSYQPLIYEVPRHPNDVFYNVANWADDQAEFDCIYTYYTDPVTGVYVGILGTFNTYNAAQILDFTSTQFVNNMLMGDMDPEMFHQPDLHFSQNYTNLTNPAASYSSLSAIPAPATTIPTSVTNFLAGTSPSRMSSLLTDTYDLTFSKYEALYKLPVLTPTLDQLGVLMQNRNSFNLSGVTASLVGGFTSGATITLTRPAGGAAAVIPITGTMGGSSLTGSTSEVYGGQNISHISMTPGQTLTFPVQ